jgi:NAD(P)-dependent dehydrogenase (short-subunit alcohol dehydrogenase family)
MSRSTSCSIMRARCRAHWSSRKQKRELGFELNAVVSYILTMEFLPLLRKGEVPLVLQTSSNSLLLVRRFAPEELKRPKSFKKLTGPYGRSKLALTLWKAAVASELLHQGIHLLSVDPGPTKTPMSASSGMPAWLLPFVISFSARPLTWLPASRLLFPRSELERRDFVLWPGSANFCGARSWQLSGGRATNIVAMATKSRVGGPRFDPLCAHHLTIWRPFLPRKSAGTAGAQTSADA